MSPGAEGTRVTPPAGVAALGAAALGTPRGSGIWAQCPQSVPIPHPRGQRGCPQMPPAQPRLGLSVPSERRHERGHLQQRRRGAEEPLCRDVSRYVAICRAMSRYVALCRSLSPGPEPTPHLPGGAERRAPVSIQQTAAATANGSARKAGPIEKREGRNYRKCRSAEND